LISAYDFASCVVGWDLCIRDMGKPVINRANRSYEIFYINGRYIRSALISKAVEEGYQEYLMQHKFPFCILHFQVDTEKVDVNVHPSKMEVRIADGPAFHEEIKNAVYQALHAREMIPEVSLSTEKERAEEIRKTEKQAQKEAPEPFEQSRIRQTMEKERQQETVEQTRRPSAVQTYLQESRQGGYGYDEVMAVPRAQSLRETTVEAYGGADSPGETAAIPKGEQMELFDDRLLGAAARAQYEIIGQLFETYWLISYQEKLLIVDQHAAHEKVRYERLMRRFREKEIVSQSINPPRIVTLNNREKEVYLLHAADFEALGFVVEEFGGNDYAIRGVPLDLYGYAEGDYFYEILDELSEEPAKGTPESIRNRIATMACKAAVKGNMRISRPEMEALLDELLTLENPYNCPHGRPTIVSMSKYEIEKKFKRIV
ncbi:MAG: DNA mismatch repair endonuclease MutL, partial [Lachnospiraceae bacterium]|nr:DNA mismatch repair endonuclease MutL [Lachnospiraceae bacterium]